MILSILGAFATIITFAFNAPIRTYPIRLIMYLCVCIVIGFVAFLIAFEPWLYTNPGPCIVTAICVHYFFLANFLWTFCIAFNFYQMIVRRNREASSLEKYYHIACWGIPVIFCAFTGGFTEYGDLGGVCYIKSPLVRFLCFFISIGLSWIFGYLMFLLPFPIVTDIFFVLFSITTPLQGLFIFAFYTVNAKVLAAWMALFGECGIPFCAEWSQRFSQQSTTFRSGSRSGSNSGSSSS